MSFWVTDGTMNDLLGPLWLFLFPVAIIARLADYFAALCCLRPLSHASVGIFSNAKVRYFAPLWLLLFWFCGWAWSYLKGQSIWVRAVSKITVGLLVGASLLWNLQADEALLVKRGTYLLGHQDKETYLKNHYGPYEAYRYCNTQLPENATILLMGEPVWLIWNVAPFFLTFL